jgi:endo-1,4-beta-xylanase
MPAARASAAQGGLLVDFEDGSAQGFAPRGGNEILQVTDEQAHGGKYSLKVSGRTAAWNGPSLRIENIVRPDGEYEVTAWVRAITPDSSNFRLSSQIGEGGAASYVNMSTAVVNVKDGWVKLAGKYRYPGAGYLSVYVENDDASAEYYIDDVSVTELEGSKLNAYLSLPSLAAIYKNDFLIGCSFSAKDLSGVRYDLIRHHFNVLTMENSMKPDAMQREAGAFTFDAADGMIAAVQGAGMLLHGHTLVWHQQSPPWLNTDAEGKPLPRAEAERNLAAHIKGVAGHYAGKVISWDVVNEAIMDNPANPRDWRASLRRTDWLNAFANGAAAPQSGADYIEQAFLAAREADPNAKLYYNDYNLDSQAKAIAVAGMVKEINDDYLAQGHDRLLIEGIGMQGHYNMGTKPEDVEASIKRFIELGVEISIPELDISVVGAPADGLTQRQAKPQAELYARLFLVFKKYAGNIVRVTFWGLDDGASWRAPQYPLLFNADLSAKEAFRAVADPEGYLGLSEKTPEEAPTQSAETPSATAEGLPAAETPARSAIPLWVWLAGGAAVVIAAAACALIFRKKAK